MESADVNFNTFSLQGDETLIGSFSKYGTTGEFIESYEQFEIHLKRIDHFFNDNIKLAWKYTNNQWEAYSPSQTLQDKINLANYEQFDSINKSEGIWILAENNFTIEESKDLESDTLNIYEGWNLVSSPNSFSIKPVLLNNTKLIWKYSDSQWYAYSKEYNITDISIIESNEGFWVYNDSSIGYLINDEDNITITRVANRTAPKSSSDHLWLTGDFTDTDNDGMTDIAEIEYGYDKNDPLSFPSEIPQVIEKKITITDSEIDAYIETKPIGITIKWENTDTTNYSLTLHNGDQQLYYGGHYIDSAEVNFGTFNLDGNETLIGHFSESNTSNGSFITSKKEFTIDLSSLNIAGSIGDENNTISYSFSGFDNDDETLYRDFLKKVFPIMRKRLGPPAESFNCVITNMGPNSDYFMIVDSGRTFLTDTSFIPRLIIHEFIHAWKGSYSITSNENWEYDNALSGFEEATAEGMAFEIVHEYVRTYSTDVATQTLLAYRPHQYQSRYTNHLDTIRFQRNTGSGDFWGHTGSHKYKYATASVIFQTIVKEYPNFYQDTMQDIYHAINSDKTWRPTRERVIDIWKNNAPTVQGVALDKYLEAMPVFNGKKLDEGIHILNSTRHYGNIGDQQFAVTYVNDNGETWWNTLAENIRDNTKWNTPDWLNWIEGPRGWAYQDVINQPFTINVLDMMGSSIDTFHKINIGNYDEDGIPDGLGWTLLSELNMQDWDIGLYKQNITFDNFIAYDNGASEEFYFFGYKDYPYQKDDFIIMLGVDIPKNIESKININNTEYLMTVDNGVAVFEIPGIALDYVSSFTTLWLPEFTSIKAIA